MCAVVFFLLHLLASCQPGNGDSTHHMADAADSNKMLLDTLPAEEPVVSEEPKEIFDLHYIMGRFDPAKHPSFTKVDIRHADREGLYLRKDVYEAFKIMYQHALDDSIRLQIRSATRNFNYQKGIWERKWNGSELVEGGENLAESTSDSVERALKILRYSAMPGASRHHWGTDIDLNNFENSWFAAGEGLDIYNWLKAHAAEHGFCQPYTAGRPHGYLEERWHWTYMPVSVALTQLAQDSLKDEMITGFSGSETATKIGVVKKYVLGISEECR